MMQAGIFFPASFHDYIIRSQSSIIDIAHGNDEHDSVNPRLREVQQERTW